jgi:hypothetical protein
MRASLQFTFKSAFATLRPKAYICFERSRQIGNKSFLLEGKIKT